MESYMDLKVVCQEKEGSEKNALGPFIHCRGKTPGTNRLNLSVAVFLLDRLGRCLKLFVSTVSSSFHGFVSQFGLAIFL